MAAVLLGIITVGAGSVARDVLAGDRPGLLYRSELYLILSAIGATAYVALSHTQLDKPVLLLSIAAVVAIARLVALRLQWHSPVPGSRHK